jgi:hypothetical protein
LTLCLPHPPPPPPPGPCRSTKCARARKAALSSNATRRSLPSYRVALGFQVSHRGNRPLFGRATVRCGDGCRCCADGDGCEVDTLGARLVTITEFLRLDVRPLRDAERNATAGPGRCAQCAVTVANTNNASERSRVVLRAVISGQHGSQTNWVIA